MKKILIVFGTRPEAIKMYPIIKECKKRKNLQTIICVTGQHKDMLEQVLQLFKIEPDYNLNVMVENQTLKMITQKVLDGVSNVIEKEKPDIVLVHGDTTTAFSAALASFYLQVPVGHVEAGLRTYKNTPYPEEFNRVSIDHMSKYNFAPTQNAVNNLLKEGIDKATIQLTGNTVVDVLKDTIIESYSNPLIEKGCNEKIALITLHRRENLKTAMKKIFKVLKKFADENVNVKFIYPVHPNPIIRKAVEEELQNCKNILKTEPMNIIDFHNILLRVDLVLTDSGGVQEEATSLGKNVIVLRENTERIESIEAGCSFIASQDPNELYTMIKKLLSDNITKNCAVNPFGDGKASRRIVETICKKV